MTGELRPLVELRDVFVAYVVILSMCCTQQPLGV
jgi:hypothetical protein